MEYKIEKTDFLIIFFVSLLSISLELFFTRMLTLKAWNHVVYIVIPFAILGYGIGANIHLIFNTFFSRFQKKTILSVATFALAFFSIASAFALIHLDVRVDYLTTLFRSWESIGMISAAYTIFMIPFLFVGFIIVYLFSISPQKVNKLYFIDLIGAGIGAALFFPLINHFAVVRSIILLSFICAILSLVILKSKKAFTVSALCILVFVLVFPQIPEPHKYSIDRKKGWEWIEGFFKKSDYDFVASRWHPLGRTDAYRMLNKEIREKMYYNGSTFLLNVHPAPEFTYISTNFIAGTPAYKLSEEGLSEFNSKIIPFSIIQEAPYLFLNKPNVLVIGAGGGRDLFMAKVHNASKVIGAEINPGIVREMSPGGALHEYTGGIYTDEGVKVHLIDGRNLVKKMDKKSFNLIVLNGVDTLDALSSGAYAYAESYLYTKEAMMDNLEILDDDGMVVYHRWYFRNMPRESLRLHAIALEALKEIGAQRPWDHIFIGTGNGWAMTIIKKTPFSADQISELQNFSHKFNFAPIYPATKEMAQAPFPIKAFDLYAQFFKKDQQRVFEQNYPYDISITTDNRPFFYKYYKLKDFNPFNISAIWHMGTIIFMSQLVVFLQALFFIILFILLPLYMTKKNDISKMPKKSILPFIIFYSCLGGGFMLIEIPVMQRFVLLLGSPIYSITVILTTLLISAGLGSFSLKKFLRLTASHSKLLTIVTFFIVLYLALLVQCGTGVYDHFLFFPFWVKVSLVALIIFPLGFSLGLYFPSGLDLISKNYKDTIAWAWALNGGFSVLGSILSIIIAQFFGFNNVLYFAAVVYLIGLMAFRKLETSLSS